MAKFTSIRSRTKIFMVMAPHFVPFSPLAALRSRRGPSASTS